MEAAYPTDLTGEQGHALSRSIPSAKPDGPTRSRHATSVPRSIPPTVTGHRPTCRLPARRAARRRHAERLWWFAAACGVAMGLAGAATVSAHEGHGAPGASAPAAASGGKQDPLETYGGVAPSVAPNPRPATQQQDLQKVYGDAASAAAGVPRHGGQVYKTAVHAFEVVYWPRETRVYVYDAAGRPVSPRDVQGQIVMQVRGNPTLFRYPVRYMGGATVADEFLQVPVEVQQIRDGDMVVTVELNRLPLAQQEPSIQFRQTFFLTRDPKQVQVYAVTDADRPGIARQRTCPVMNAALGEHGDPVKVVVGQQVAYLCCESCLEEFQKDPATYLARLSPEQPPTANRRRSESCPGGPNCRGCADRR